MLEMESVQTVLTGSEVWFENKEARLCKKTTETMTLGLRVRITSIVREF